MVSHGQRFDKPTYSQREGLQESRLERRQESIQRPHHQDNQFGLYFNRIHQRSACRRIAHQTPNLSSQARSGCWCEGMTKPSPALHHLGVMKSKNQRCDMICWNRAQLDEGSEGGTKMAEQGHDFTGQTMDWGRDKTMGCSELRFRGHVRVEMPGWGSAISLKLTRLQPRAVTDQPGQQRLPASPRGGRPGLRLQGSPDST